MQIPINTDAFLSVKLTCVLASPNKKYVSCSESTVKKGEEALKIYRSNLSAGYLKGFRALFLLFDP